LAQTYKIALDMSAAPVIACHFYGFGFAEVSLMWLVSLPPVDVALVPILPALCVVSAGPELPWLPESLPAPLVLPEPLQAAAKIITPIAIV